jgi:hypothetical protein
VQKQMLQGKRTSRSHGTRKPVAFRTVPRRGASGMNSVIQLKGRHRAEHSVRRWLADNRAVVGLVMLGLLVAAWFAVKG